MDEQLISFKTAELAKDKGFSVSVINYYDKNKHCTYSEDYQTERLAESNWNNGNGSYPTLSKEVLCSAPTQSLLQKWLREVHNIYIEIEHWHNEKEGFIKCGYKVYTKHENTGPYIYNNKIITYEEALEKGLQEALKLI